MSKSLTPAKPIIIMNSSITITKPVDFAPCGAAICTISKRAIIIATSPELMPISRCFFSI